MNNSAIYDVGKKQISRIKFRESNCNNQCPFYYETVPSEVPMCNLRDKEHLHHKKHGNLRFTIYSERTSFCKDVVGE